MKNLIDFEKEMTMEVLEERLEMVAHGGSCERKCSGGDGGDGGDTINGDGGNGGSGDGGPEPTFDTDIYTN
jgi:hypothetical protein